MKNLPSALADFLAQKREEGDTDIATADIYRLTLSTGEEFLCNSSDVDLDIDGETFRSGGVMVQGLRYKSSIGLDSDQQQIVLLYDEDQVYGGAPLVQAINNGLLNYCTIERSIAYYSDDIGGTLVGHVLVYRGRIVSVDRAGPISSDITVANSLVVLENDYPRNSYGPPCQHILYDSGCGLDRADFSTLITAGDGTGSRYIFTSLATDDMIGGYAEFLSGSCSGARATVKNVSAGVWIELILVSVGVPSVGDTLTVYQGCDHTRSTCETKFANLDNFRGFPYVPPPQFAQ